MGSAGWDEVLGGGAGDDPPPPHENGSGGEDGAPPPKKKRIKTSTKIVLVVAGWLLLTLFLVGRFSSDKQQPSAVARLDTVSGADGADGEEEVFEPEPVDTEEEELLDVDGDGFLSAAEQGITEGEAAASVDDGGTFGGGSSGGGGGSTSGGDGSTSGGNAVPGAAPSTGGTTGGSTAPTTSTTATSGGGGGGGGGGATTTTTTTKSGGATTTTTTRPTTTTTTGGGNPPPPPTGVNVLVRAVPEKRYSFPAGYTSDLSLPISSTISFNNDEDDRKHSFTITQGATVVWDSGEISDSEATKTSTPLLAGTYNFGCTNHPVNMRGTITVA